MKLKFVAIFLLIGLGRCSEDNNFSPCSIVGGQAVNQTYNVSIDGQNNYENIESYPVWNLESNYTYYTIEITEDIEGFKHYANKIKNHTEPKPKKFPQVETFTIHDVTLPPFDGDYKVKSSLSFSVPPNIKQYIESISINYHEGQRKKSTTINGADVADVNEVFIELNEPYHTYDVEILLISNNETYYQNNSTKLGHTSPPKCEYSNTSDVF